MSIFNIFSPQASVNNEVRGSLRSPANTDYRQNVDKDSFAPLMEQSQKALLKQNTQSGQSVPFLGMAQHVSKPESREKDLQSALNFANGSLVTQSSTALQGLMASGAHMPEAMAKLEALEKTQANAEDTRAVQASQVVESKNNSYEEIANAANRAENAKATENTQHFAPTLKEREEAKGIALRQSDIYSPRGIPLHQGQGIALNALRHNGIALDSTSLRRLENVAKRQGEDTSNQLTQASLQKNQPAVQPTKMETSGAGLGHLSAQFESGGRGFHAIGYDKNGGTSYGKYQIASRPGSMDKFIAFLQEKAPDLAKFLENAGPSNTGSRSGAMPEAWKKLASSEPKRFGDLQEQFIHESHYLPALEGLEKAGYSTENFSEAMKEVLWSTAVQHGPKGAIGIFEKVATALNVQDVEGKMQEPAIIEQVYAERADRFQSSTPRVQDAVRKRMESEKLVALNLYERNLTS